MRWRRTCSAVSTPPDGRSRDAPQRRRCGREYCLDIGVVAWPQDAWRVPGVRRGQGWHDSHDDATRAAGENIRRPSKLPGAWLDRDRWAAAVLGVAHAVRA